MTDRLYDTSTTGELLGGKHPNDVLRLIHDGRLKAKKQSVRGDKCPRYYVTASEINRYIRDLPNADDSTVEPPKPDRKPNGVAKELRTARTYI